MLAQGRGGREEGEGEMDGYMRGVTGTGAGTCTGIDGEIVVACLILVY